MARLITPTALNSLLCLELLLLLHYSESIKKITAPLKIHGLHKNIPCGPLRCITVYKVRGVPGAVAQTSKRFNCLLLKGSCLHKGTCSGFQLFFFSFKTALLFLNLSFVIEYGTE